MAASPRCVIAIVLFSAACTPAGRDTKDNPNGVVATLPSGSEPLAPLDAARTPTPEGCSFAVFLSAGTRLAACVDFVMSDTIDYFDALDRSDASAKDRARGKAFLTEAGIRTAADFMCVDDIGGMLKGGKSVSQDSLQEFGIHFNRHDVERLPQTCAATFAQHAEVASCAVNGAFPGDLPQNVTSEAVTHFYDLDVLSNDVALRNCLKRAGHWSAIAKDSDEYRRERLGRLLERTNVAAP